MSQVLSKRASRSLPIGRDGALWLGGAGAGLAGIASAAAPLVGLGLLGALLLGVLPWGALFAITVITAQANRIRFPLGALRIQLVHPILLLLALRVFLLTRREVRPKWHAAEFAVAAFAVLQFVTSVLNAANRKQSVQTAGLLALGCLAYLITYTGTCTRKRLIYATRAVLYAVMAGAAVALMAVVLHFVAGSNLGVQRIGGKFAVRALDYEHDILGSFSASGAIALFVLRRERNPVISHLAARFGFWLCFVAMILAEARAAWLAFVVVLVLVLLVRRTRRRRRRDVGQLGVGLLFLAVGVVGAIWAASYLSSLTANNVLAQNVTEKAAQIINFSSGTGAARLSEDTVALHDFKRSPIIGLGTNSYGQRHAAGGSTIRNPITGYLGNLYVRTLYDSGVVGFVLLLMAFLGGAWPTRVVRRGGTDLAPVAAALSFGFIVMAVAFAATDASLQPWPWIVLGLARAARSMAQDQEREGLAHGPALTNGHRQLDLPPPARALPGAGSP
jgi:hypothetical protein